MIFKSWAIRSDLLTLHLYSRRGSERKITLFFFILLGFFLLMLNNSCNKTEETKNIAPLCAITNPYGGYITERGAFITISADADDSDGQITEVRFYVDDSFIGLSTASHYNYVWNTIGQNIGKHTIEVIAKDNNDDYTSNKIEISLTEVGGSLAWPIAAFSVNETNIITGSSIQFTDQSTNLPTSWLWDFGDGNISTSQNPVHSYLFAGQYSVKLVGSNLYGSDSVNKEQFITVATPETGTITDYNGNNYKTIKIGNQWWMSENLKSAHYSDGTEIPLVENKSSWSNLSFTDKAYCYYDNSLTNATIYGALYTWAAAMNGAATSETNPSDVQGICPCNWHLPSDAEWIELEMYLGMSFSEADAFGWRGTDEGNKMKTTSGWYNGGNGSNSSGFSALPAGQRALGSFTGLTLETLYWSSTEYINITYLAFNRTLNYQYSTVGWFKSSHFYGYPKNYGFSVRCVKNHF